MINFMITFGLNLLHLFGLHETNALNREGHIRPNLLGKFTMPCALFNVRWKTERVIFRELGSVRKTWRFLSISQVQAIKASWDVSIFLVEYRTGFCRIVYSATRAGWSEWALRQQCRRVNVIGERRLRRPCRLYSVTRQTILADALYELYMRHEACDQTAYLTCVG